MGPLDEYQKISSSKYRRRFAVDVHSPKKAVKKDSEYLDKYKTMVKKSSSKKLLEELKRIDEEVIRRFSKEVIFTFDTLEPLTQIC